MSSQEIDITLTPEQATYGVILTVPLATGPARVRIPSSSRDGDLVRTRVGDQEVLVRIRVPGTAVPPQSGAAAKPGAVGCMVAVGVVAAVLVGLALIGSGDDTDNKASTASTPTPSASSSPTYPSYSPSYAPANPTREPTPDTSTEPAPASPTSTAPSPFDKGTCLNGTLPDSTTAQRVDDVEEVPCSASDAHYRVIESIPLTSDMSRCDDNPKTEYAFSYRYTLNGAVINEYVYCLVGIGSYAR
ncbi:hypothetical protein ABZX75_24745 [Streptomyces sp. NPDC003038]|uniref:LppU/SCO3897 family protein n=1 Tax=unclassified Streptomyces TaxID=2593676 RepID=UPI0033A30B29